MTETLKPSSGSIWLVVSCKPRQEFVAAENLGRQGYEIYFPRMKSQLCRQRVWQEVVQPLFPRYLFLHIDPTQKDIVPIRSTRGAVGIVRFGGIPAQVPEAVVLAIMAREDQESRLHVNPDHIFSKGDRILVRGGPLEGMEGIFSNEDGTQRALVFLELLGKANRIKVPLSWLAKIA